MTEAPTPRRFCVHDLHEADNRAHVVEGVTFEDAALLFVEQFHPSDGEGVRLDIQDLDTGERQCLHIDLETGLAEPCRT